MQETLHLQNAPQVVVLQLIGTCAANVQRTCFKEVVYRVHLSIEWLPHLYERTIILSERGLMGLTHVGDDERRDSVSLVLR